MTPPRRRSGPPQRRPRGASDPGLFVGPSELAALMREKDWTQTAVGSPDGWPQSVRAIIRLMLTSRYAMWMGWGAELTFFYNDAYARMTLGAKHPWALGQRADHVWAEIWPDIGPRIQHVLKTGDATWDEGLLLFLERSGFSEETYHTFSYSPVHDDAGRTVGMFCVVTEDTDRVIGERRLGLLRDLGARLGASQTLDDVWRAVEQLADADARDLPFTLSYMFEEDGAHAGLRAASGMPPGHRLRPDTVNLDRPWPLRQVLNSGTETEVPLDLEADGPWASRLLPSRAFLIPIPQPGQSRPAGVFIAGVNPFRPLDGDYESFLHLYVGQIAAALVSAQAYEDERRRAEALAQLDRAKMTFFSNASHELRTPLTLILGPVADALTASRPMGGETLELIHRNALRLRRLVNGLLDFSRIEAGRIEARFEPIDLGLHTAELASLFRSAIERAGLRLDVDCPSTPPVYVDRDMWEKVVLNLLSNALKFTFRGEIAVSLVQEPGAVRLDVRDTGLGIPAAELPRIFRRFHRVEGVVGRTHEGSGIGLALVQELVRLHGGTIAAASTLGIGTTFTVRIPLGSAHLPPAHVSPSRRPAGHASEAQAFVDEVTRWLPGEAPIPVAERDEGVPSAPDRTRSSSAARLLVVDDNADMRAYLRSLLAPRWVVDTAESGEAALAQMRQAAPDLVLSDIMMVGLDGFGLLAAIRADERIRHTPVVLLSARAGEEARVEGLEAGADDYLVKPFSGRELVARIDANLRFAAAARERAELVAREQATRERAELARQDLYGVFMTAPLPIALIRGRSLVVELANDAACALCGRPRTEIVGRPLLDALPELAAQGLADRVLRVLETQEPAVGTEVPVALARSPGAAIETVYLNFVFTPLRHATGEPDGVLAVGTDVTAQVRARQEIASLRESAEAASRAKDEFLAMLGHELRNPLAPILTALQLMNLRDVGVVKREREVIERQVNHLVALVDDLLDVSRITRGKIELKREPLEMADIVSHAIEMTSPLLEQQRHDLRVEVAPSGLVVDGDPRRLAQVLANLLTNAAKYTEAGGRIEVAARAVGDHVVLEVRDSGIGIDADMLPRVFELFTQERQALDRSRGGLGLGLAIVRSIVELHGGRVSAASPGKARGSVFTVRLPRLLVPAEVAVGPGVGAAHPRPGDNGIRVLIVDDNDDAAEMLADLVASFGYVARAVYDGPSALMAASQYAPDIAIVDIGLPIMDGYEVAMRFRDSPALARTKLVAVTGYGQPQDRAKSAAAGFVAHLVKPVTHDQVRAVLDDVSAVPPSLGAPQT